MKNMSVVSHFSVIRRHKLQHCLTAFPLWIVTLRYLSNILLWGRWMLNFCCCQIIKHLWGKREKICDFFTSWFFWNFREVDFRLIAFLKCNRKSVNAEFRIFIAFEASPRLASLYEQRGIVSAIDMRGSELELIAPEVKQTAIVFLLFWAVLYFPSSF